MYTHIYMYMHMYIFKWKHSKTLSYNIVVSNYERKKFPIEMSFVLTLEFQPGELCNYQVILYT